MSSLCLNNFRRADVERGFDCTAGLRSRLRDRNVRDGIASRTNFLDVSSFFLVFFSAFYTFYCSPAASHVHLVLYQILLKLSSS